MSLPPGQNPGVLVPLQEDVEMHTPFCPFTRHVVVCAVTCRTSRSSAELLSFSNENMTGVKVHLDCNMRAKFVDEERTEVE
jgi:hypothetical protein